MAPVSNFSARPTANSHAVLRRPNTQPTRPTLPDIAPVSLPDFTQPPSLIESRNELVPQVEISGAVSDYDNVCMSTRQRPVRSKGVSVKAGRASARNPASGAQRRANRWQLPIPGDESDAMSG